jgi:hypothetical protein
MGKTARNVLKKPTDKEACKIQCIWTETKQKKPNNSKG